MKAKNKKSKPYDCLRESIGQRTDFLKMRLSIVLCMKSNPMGSTAHWSNADFLNFKSQLVTRTENSVNAENNESFIYMLFKLYVQV